ncbi:MAG: DeoR/GlpR family DNA-binding transcription regulator [Clostridia bacterium]|nr:DeoR/GlpR family DNA-binding transcription regulator [Clostridia bacterium]
MLMAERQKKILELLRESEFLSIAELCGEMHFSESTLRRDLQKMAHAGLITCTRGGAMANSAVSMETPVELRQEVNHAVKCRIAREAAQLVGDNQILMMDASTTVMEMIPFLKSKRNLTIITCCLTLAQRVADELNCTLICPGGKYHRPTASFTGINAISSLSNWFADMMFFSCTAIDPVNGLTDNGDDFAQLKTAMLQQSKRAILLADSGKFGSTASYRLHLNNISDIVVDYQPILDQDEWKSYRQKMIFV